MSEPLIAPATADELADVIALAKQGFAIKGGGTRGVMAAGSQTLSTASLSGITMYEPGALTLVVQAGTPVADIETVLKAEGQRLAFEPADLRSVLGTSGTPTIGGVVATNTSGPRRVSVGACRDFLLGVRFVDGTGRQVQNGGRVMKNVTGYDLVKLLAGSYGTLGVLTEVSLKVLPKPECTGVLLINGLTDSQAVHTMSKALGSPYEITGAAHAPSGVDGHPVTMLRIEGFEDSVTYRLSELQKWLGAQADAQTELSADRTAAGWAWVRDALLLQGRAGNIWRVSVKPSDAPGLVARIQTDAVLYDWGGGLIWLLTPPNENVRDKMSGLEGHATLVRGSAFQRFHPENAVVERLTQGLRHKFDPRGLFNPGLMG